MSRDLFAHGMRAEDLLSRRLRLEMVPTDTMEPTLRSRWDFVLVRPVEAYEGEGIYLINDELGSWKLSRASNTLGGKSGHVLLYVDNKRYSERLVSREWFDENVLAIVVADIKVRDHQLLQAVAPHEVRP